MDRQQLIEVAERIETVLCELRHAAHLPEYARSRQYGSLGVVMLVNAALEDTRRILEAA